MKKFLFLLLFGLPLPSFGADCYIKYYNYIGRTQDGREIQVAREPALDEEKVTYTSSTQSGVFPTQTQLVAVVCNATAHFAVGEDPTATADNFYIPADVPFFFGVTSRNLKIAFYDGTT